MREAGRARVFGMENHLSPTGQSGRSLDFGGTKRMTYSSCVFWRLRWCFSQPLTSTTFRTHCRTDLLGYRKHSVEQSTRMQRKRQTEILYASVGLFVMYVCLQLAPSNIRTLVALTAIPCLLLLAGYVIGYRKLRDSKLRFPYLALPFLLLAVFVFLVLPDFRRARLRWQLESLGACVTLEFDDTYKYLPIWLKEELDWAFLGRIKQVDFRHKLVPIIELKSLSFDEPFWFLDLESCDLSPDQLNQIPEFMDVTLVNLINSNADIGTLEAFASMPSVKRLILFQHVASRFKITCDTLFVL